MSTSSSSSSSAFRLICLLYSAIALTSGALIMFYTKKMYDFTHEIETATKFFGSTPHEQLLIRTSDFFSGLLLFGIEFLLFKVSIAKECTALHVFVALWRFWFERRVEDLA